MIHKNSATVIVTTRLPAEVGELVDDIAMSERRTRSMVCSLLIEEALVARKALKSSPAEPVGRARKASRS